MESIFAALGQNPSATLVLAIVVLCIVTGLLVPKWVAQTWRHAWELSEQARIEQGRQIERLLESSTLQNRLLESIRDEAARKQDSK